MKPSERAIHFDAVDAWSIFAIWAGCEGHWLAAVFSVVLCIAMVTVHEIRKQREQDAEDAPGAASPQANDKEST